MTCDKEVACGAIFKILST